MHPRAIVLLAGAGLLGLGVFGVGVAQAQCVSVPLPSFAPVTVCTAEPAEGTVAVSGTGPARGAGPLNAAAVSGTGQADRSLVSVSATGAAGTPTPQGADPCQATAGGRNVASGVAVSGTGGAYSCFASVSGGGDARSPLVAVSATGDSGARLVSVSGTGTAGGHSNPNHPPDEPTYRGGFVSVSACRADNTGPQDQLLTVDPTRIWVQTNPATNIPLPLPRACA